VKLVKLVLAAGALGAVAYGVLAVPLGGHTTWEWGRSVFGTPEAKAAGEGLKRGAGEAVDKAVGDARDVARTALGGTAGEDAAGATGTPSSPAAAPSDEARPYVAPPMDEHPPADEAKLRRLLGARSAAPAPR
jgi:hypothetical protein